MDFAAAVLLGSPVPVPAAEVDDNGPALAPAERPNARATKNWLELCLEMLGALEMKSLQQLYGKEILDLHHNESSTLSGVCGMENDPASAPALDGWIPKNSRLQNYAIAYLALE